MRGGVSYTVGVTWIVDLIGLRRRDTVLIHCGVCTRVNLIHGP